MRYVVFDIETSNIFQDVGKRDPALLDLAVIAVYDSETGAYTTYFQEKLSDLWPVFERADAIVGYNSDHFDIPLLDKYYAGDLRRIKSIDLMKTITQSFGRRVGLDAVAKTTLGIQKSADGLQATRWWKKGEKEKVCEYCIQDVKVTKELFEHMREHKNVKLPDYNNNGKVITLDVDVSDWEKNEKGAMTQSMPF